MKKVLVVVDNLNQGGIASVVLRIHDAINKKIFTMDYVTYIKPSIDIQQKIEKTGGKIYLVNRLSRTTPLKYIKSIKKVIKDNGPYDVIHVHTSSFIWLACLAAKMAGVPIRVGHAHGSKNVVQFPFSNLLYSLFKSLNRKYCTTMLACADTSGKFTFGENYNFMPNFIDHTEYITFSNEKIDNFLKKQKIPSSARKYCFIGYLGGEKNPSFALELFNKILTHDKNSYLLLAGDGPEMTEIKKYVKLNNMMKNVIILGNTNEVKQILQISDIFLMPSFSEGMSMAALEAQVSGVPCIVSKGVPDTNDIQAGLFHKCQTYELSEWYNVVNNIFLCGKKISTKEAIISLKSIGYDKDSVTYKLESIYLGETKL